MLTHLRLVASDRIGRHRPKQDGHHQEGRSLIREFLAKNFLKDVNTCTRYYSERKEGNVLFNDTLNTFYLWLYGVRHMVKDHSDSERGNLLPPHGLLFLISSKGSFICIIPQRG